MRSKTGLIGIVAAVMALAGLAGCSALEDFVKGSGGTVGIAVQYATMKYIDDAPNGKEAERAASVRDTVERVRKYADGVDVSLEDLKAYALEQLSPKLSPADRFLALQIINVAAAELEERLGDGPGQLDPETQVALEKLLDQISDATLFYG